MKLLIMFYIALAILFFASAFKDWIEGLDELIAFDEYVDDLEDMLDDNTSEVRMYGYEEYLMKMEGEDE